MADDTIDPAPDPRHELIHQGAVASLLSGLNQPQPAAPQYVPPVVANTSKWEKIITGAMAGLGGGLKAGLQNIQDAGTPRGPHASGYAEGEAMQQQMAAQDQAQKDRATAQAQQDFQNKIATGKYTQEQQLNRARTMSANLSAYHTAMAIDSAPQEKQDAYYKDQDAHAEQYQKAGMSSLADLPDTNAIAGWLKQNGKSIADVVPTHHRDADGKDRISLWENPSHSVDSGTINKSLQTYGYPAVPDGTTMNAQDFNHLRGVAQSSHATALNAQTLQSQKDAASMARTQATQAGENSRESKREQFQTEQKQGGEDMQAHSDNMADMIHNGQITYESAARGMGVPATKAAQMILDSMHKKYPDDNLEALKAYGKYAEHPQTQNQLAQARTLFGAHGKPGTFDEVQGLVNKIDSTGVHWYSDKAQKAEWAGAGNGPISQIKRLLPEVANDLAQFQTGAGGRQTDSRIEGALSQMQTADTKQNLIDGFNLLRRAAGERMKGMVGENPYLKNMAKDINDPTAGPEQPVYKDGKIVAFSKDGKTISRLAQ